MGGVHSKTFSGCLITNSTIVLSVSFFSKNILSSFNGYFVFGSFFVSMVAIMAYAPSDIENMPIRGVKNRKRNRNISLVISFIYFILTVVFKANSYINILSFSLLVNSLSVLPIMYKLTGNRTGEFYNADVVAKEPATFA
jgi:accessory gene regulator B